MPWSVQFIILVFQELINKILSLQAHNLQLKNVINKSLDPELEDKCKKQKPFDFNKWGTVTTLAVLLAYYSQINFRCTFRHVLIKFLYLGWDYQGYAVQEDSINTIEHHLFKALAKTCLIKDRTLSNYHRCGRTDKGVSSFSQVSLLSSYIDHVEIDQKYCTMWKMLQTRNKRLD